MKTNFWGTLWYLHIRIAVCQQEACQAIRLWYSEIPDEEFQSEYSDRHHWFYGAWNAAKYAVQRTSRRVLVSPVDMRIQKSHALRRFGALIFQMITTRSLPIIFAELDREAKIKSVVNDIELQEFIIACCKTDPTQRPTTRQCVDTLKRIRRSGHNCTTVKISYKLRNALHVINKIFS